MLKGVIYEDLKYIYSKSIPWDKFRGKTVMITGAYGMIASYFMYMLIYLNEEMHMNIDIIPVVRSKEKYEARFEEYAYKSYMHPCYTSLDDELANIQHIDFFIHAASFASPQYYDQCPVDVLKPNVIGTYNLLELTRKQDVVDGFLFFSTGDVYGVTDGQGQVKEGDYGIVDPLDIHSCYSESKRMAETMCYSYYHQYGVPIKIARIWHTYSPTMDIDNDPRVFASFIHNVLNNENIVMKSEGVTKRAFCYIADTISGLFFILLMGKEGEAYNVCNTDQYYSIKDFAEVIASLDEKKQTRVISIKRNENEHYTENTAIGNNAPSNEKLKELGWSPKYDIYEGFGRVIKHFRDDLNEK